MTIAACFLTAEGVVLGADSTVTIASQNGNRYYDHAQKLFQLTDHLGVVIWGDVPSSISYRTLIATFSDDLVATPARSVEDAAQRWANFCSQKLAELYADELVQAASARIKLAAGTALPDEEKWALEFVENFGAGFCIGGHVLPDRTPAAFQMLVTLGPLTPVPDPISVGHLEFWGAPNILRRVLTGTDWRVLDGILDAKKADGTKMWTGTEDELYEIAFAHSLRVHPGIPIREAVDLVHSSILTTIKALKFSHFDPTCGGPIEVATVTSDRTFRWVKHKSFDAAL